MQLIFFIRWLSCVLLCLNTAFAFASSPQIQVSFILDKNNPNNTYQAHIILQNNSSTNLSNWTLWFNTVAGLTQTNPGKIIHPTGGFYGLAGPVISAHQEIIINIAGKNNVTNRSFTPQGYFLTAGKNNETLYEVASNYDLSVLNPTPSLSHKTPKIIAENSIIPKPVSLQYTGGQFTLNQKTVIIIPAESSGLLKTATDLQKIIAEKTGWLLPIQVGTPTQIMTADSSKSTKKINQLTNAIFLELINSKQLGNEGYQITVTSQKILLSANTTTGIFYSAQTLQQILQPFFLKSFHTTTTLWRIPNLKITDYPRYAYRGFHLDVARHFFRTSEIKHLLDLMAMHKLNVFHWHLSDDEGWRIQIIQFPELTQIGAWRGFKESLPPAFGSGFHRYGGFYTQEQIKEIVKYAQNLHITIIPEIDMPGHARALLKSLPQLVDQEDSSSYTSIQGYKDNVLSPCIENTYEVLSQILQETSQLFPNHYIHIGGDEIPNGVWQQSPGCKQLIKDRGLTSTNQLNGYFVERIQKILNTNNKLLAGWQEVAEELPSSNHQLIFIWSDKASLKTLIHKGYDVILMPGSHLYFDLAYNNDPCEIGYHWAGFVDTQKVYSYESDTQGLNSTEINHIRGIEGALWSENLDSMDLLEYMAFPRMAALSEIAWTPRELRNWQDFYARLTQYYLPRLDRLHINYRREHSQLCR